MKYNRTPIAWLLLITGLLITVYAAFYIRSDVEKIEKAEFTFECNEISSKIVARLHAHAQILRSGAAFFSVSDTVTREEWKNFVEDSKINLNLPGMQGLGFNLLIPPEKLELHIRQTRNEGFPEYSVKPEGKRDTYTSIIFIEPFSGRNLRAFGYDTYSESVRREAMERARDRNVAALSGKVMLVQETGTDVQAGNIMFVPVYRKGTVINTVEQRREAIIGWISSPYRMNDFMAGILEGWELLENKKFYLHIFDGMECTPQSMLFESHLPEEHLASENFRFFYETPIDFNGHRWTLQFTQGKEKFIINYISVWITLAGGIAISFLLFFLTKSLINTEQKARSKAEMLTAELKENERLLHDREERLRMTVKAGNVGLWDWDLTTNKTHFSVEWKNQLGYADNELENTYETWESLFHPDDLAPTLEKLKASLTPPWPPYEVEFRLRHKNGSYRWILSKGSLQFNENGKPIYMLGSHIDITEQKNAENEIKNLSNFNQRILENIGEGIYGINVDGNCTFINPAGANMLGYKVHELIGKQIHQKFHYKKADGSDYKNTDCHIYKSFKEGKVYRISDEVFWRMDGSPFPVEYTSTPIYENGKISGAVVVYKDITERKQIETKLKQQSNNMASLLDISQVLSSTMDIKVVLQLIVERACSLFELDSGAIYIINDEELYLGATTPALPPEFPEVFRHAKLADHPHLAQSVSTGIPVVLPDMAEADLSPAERIICENRNLRSVLYLPLLINKQAVAILILGTTGEKYHLFSDDEIKLYRTLASHAALSIENTRLYEQTQRYAGELEQRVNERTTELLKTKQRLEYLLTSASVVIKSLSVNSPFLPTYIGGNIKQMMGYDPQQFMEDPDFWTGKIHPDDAPLVFEEMPLLFKNGHLAHEYRFLQNNGTYRWIRDELILIRDQDNQPSEILGYWLDITEQKEAEIKINKAKQEAEQANRAKSEFLSRMSHELRTPMNSILGFAQLMKMGELKEAHRKGVDHIINSGKHLLYLINEVLDISKIESGHVSLSIEPVEICRLMHEIKDIIIPLAAGKQITVEINQGNNFFVKADLQRLKQVLLNLANNAIKYNKPNGFVKVNCELTAAEGTQHPNARINITDSGGGISPEDIKKLFNPFERIGAEKTETEGTGLGLVVVKKLVDAMGGTVGVESELGKGSTFWVELLLAETPLKRERQANLKEQKGETAQKTGTILYIEDNVSNVELVEQILNNHRAPVRLITNKFGENAVQLATEYKPVLILLDLDLPDIHGYEVLKKLQATPETKSIPVVIISADAMEKQIAKLLNAGAKSYLTKPLDVIEFLSVIDEWMEN